MKNKKATRVGEIRKNNQGLSMKIVRYVNNKNVTIQFVETGEKKTVRYDQFSKGLPTADLLNYPVNNDCSFKHAVIFGVGTAAVVLSVIGATIYIFLT